MRLYSECNKVNSTPVLGSEIRGLIEHRMEHTLKGIEETLRDLFEQQEVCERDLRDAVRNLEVSFTLLSEKWNLQILYTLFLKSDAGFSEIKRVLGINSRSLSDKLKALTKHGYAKRLVEEGPPLRVRYSLTSHGRDAVLLALPLLYHLNSRIEEPGPR